MCGSVLRWFPYTISHVHGSWGSCQICCDVLLLQPPKPRSSEDEAALKVIAEEEDVDDSDTFVGNSVPVSASTPIPDAAGLLRTPVPTHTHARTPEVWTMQ